MDRYELPDNMTACEERAARLIRKPQGIGPDPLAEWWRRLLGWVIDSVIIGVSVAGLWVPTVNAYKHAYRAMLLNPDIDEPSFSAVFDQHVFAIGLLTACASLGIALLYYGLLTRLWGTTPGKRALGTWVVTSAANAKPDVRSAFIRAAVFVIVPLIPFVPFASASIRAAFGPVILFFFLADNLWLLFDKQRQCLHDKAAGTVVVKRRA
jgi:uncharacterized RDD family membrane protein YckC